jgi:UDP-N-acetylglucosamine 3-dehydrogenase
MMAKFRVGFIGTGRKPEKASLQGYAMAYQHGDAYEKLSEHCEMVACADISEANAQAFAGRFGFNTVYTDYQEMLAKENLDIVSICTWPHLHAKMSIDACCAGVKAVHCEKPMATTMGDARLMLQAAAQYGTKLTFNHQRRFGKPFRHAKEILDSGEIGELVRMESNSWDLFDGGTHWIDMLNYWNNESPAAWVIGQIDRNEDRVAFGAPVETSALAHVKYRNGVVGVLVAANPVEGLGCAFRLHGTKGVIELAWSPDPGPLLRYWREGLSEWQAIDCEGENLHGPGYIERAIADVVACLMTERDSELSARYAINATEIIFAVYESSRRRGRVQLPLEIHDSPLLAMMENGDIGPAAE